MFQADWLMLLVMHQPFEIKWAIRVKSGKFGHTFANSVNPDEDFHCSVNLYFIPMFEIWNKGHCLSLAVCPNTPDFTLLKGRSTSIQIRKKMDFVLLCQQKLLSVYVFPYFTRCMILFDLILYVPSTIFQLYRDGSSWVEPVLSLEKCVLLKDHNAVTLVRLEPAALRSRVKHSTNEPLRSHTLYEGGFLAQGGAECFWHMGAGNDVLQLKKPGPKPIKYFFYGIRNKWQEWVLYGVL